MNTTMVAAGEGSGAGAGPAAGEERWRVAAYGLLALPLSFAALPLYVHLPRLYGEIVGLGLAAVGLVLLAARLFDALVDPAIGLWSDRLRERRLLIAAALPLLAIGFYGLFDPPAGMTGTTALAWLATTLVATTLAFGIVSISHQAWAVDLGRDSAARTRRVATREGLAVAGVVLAAVLPGLLAAEFAAGLARLATLFLPLLFVAALVTLAFSGKGRPRPATRQAPPAWRDLARALADGWFRRLLAVFICNGIAAALPATLVLFYVADVLRAEQLAGTFLAVYFVAGVAALPLWLAVARRVGRCGAWLASMAAATVGFAWAPFLGAGDVAPFVAVCLLSGVALGADLAMPAALLADRAELRSRADGLVQQGAYMGWWNLVGKLNFALAAGLALPLLQALGYAPGSGSGTAALALAYGALPLVFKLLAAALLWRWRHVLEDKP
jgi:GPH family glycoside/pentoside/hexuronide:cation symporter